MPRDLPTKPRILVVTACGRKKHNKPMPAWQLYKSSRIKAVYNRRMGHDMYILSAKYGLVRAEEVIEPYEALMDEEMVKSFIAQVAKVIKNYDSVVYFKGGAGKEYQNCIKIACQNSRKTLITLGYANVGGINDIPKVLQHVEKGDLNEICCIKHIKILKSDREPKIAEH